MTDIEPGAAEGDFLPVTVVIPTYNSAATLPRALASVLAQTKRPAEIIVVDDASSDETRQVLQGLRLDHSGIPIRTSCLEENVGVAEARNIGWATASQEYVAFLDSDDAWHPQKLEIQHRWMADHPDVVLCGHRCEIRDDMCLLSDMPGSGFPVHFHGLNDFLVANRLSTPSVMLRRALGERFTSGKRHSEDYLLWMQIVATHGPAAYIDLPLAFLFKARYGVSGLSGKLWQMQLGEVDTLSRLCKMTIIGKLAWLLALAWSWMKFLKRVAFLPFLNGCR